MQSTRKPPKRKITQARHDAKPERKAAQLALRKTPERRAYDRAWKAKAALDPKFRLDDAIRTGLWRALHRYGWNSSKLPITGLNSMEQLADWLESQFHGGMSWDNYGRGKKGIAWTIDHIIPCSMYGIDEQAKCWNWRNLRPCWNNYSKKDSMPPPDVLAKVPSELWPSAWGLECVV